MWDKRSGRAVRIISSFHLPRASSRHKSVIPKSLCFCHTEPSSSPCLREGGHFSFTAEPCPYFSRVATPFPCWPPLGIPHILGRAEKNVFCEKEAFCSTVYCTPDSWRCLLHTQPLGEWFSSPRLVHGEGCQKLYRLNDIPGRS